MGILKKGCLPLILPILIFLAIEGMVLLLFATSSSVLAHPGRTDSSGGHTCRTNCESWGVEYGEYHYHNDGGGVTGVDHTQEFIDASTAGKAHATSVNLSFIEAKAASAAQSAGYNDGKEGKAAVTTYYGVSDEVCQTPVTFTSTPTDYYRRTFQNYYEQACDSVYGAKYMSIYSEAYRLGKVAYEKELSENQAKESQNNLWGWVIGIIIVGVIIYFSRQG